MNVKKYLKNPLLIFHYLKAKRLQGSYGKKLSDETFLRKAFRLNMGYALDLETPKTYNEKLQWLKLYNRKPEYTMMVDKYLVRDYIAKEIGEEYLIPLLGLKKSIKKDKSTFYYGKYLPTKIYSDSKYVKV